MIAFTANIHKLSSFIRWGMQVFLETCNMQVGGI